jgi:hypothetical protein
MVKSQDAQHKCLRLSPQSFYFILVATGLAKTHGISLPEVQKWFDSDCPGVRRRPMCEGCPLRPPDYVPPAHLLVWILTGRTGDAGLDGALAPLIWARQSSEARRPRVG